MKRKIVRNTLVAFAMAGMLMAPINNMQVKAANIIATVQGTVQSNSTSGLLYLKTNEGIMQIKIDGNTNTSNCKILVPGQTVSVSVYNGGDEYLHADQISSSGGINAVNIDTDKASTVFGKVTNKSTKDVLHLEMSEGTMELKIDATTDFSGIAGVVLAGDTVYARVARGSDAYMHALSVYTNGNGGYSAGTSNSTESVCAYNGQTTTTVTGKVAQNTNSEILFLETQGGTMELKYDANTEYANVAIPTIGNKLTVYTYRGDDAYMHAARIVGTGASLNTTLGNSVPLIVSGTVSNNTDSKTLYLNTSGGMMTIKLDTNTDFSNIKSVIIGKKVTVSCKNGADEYLHALSVY